MSRSKKTRKPLFLGIWACAPLLALGSIFLYRLGHGWGVAAWLAWVLLCVLLLTPRRRRRARPRSTKPASQRRVNNYSDVDSGVSAWVGPQKAARPLNIVQVDKAQLDAWAADELAEIESAAAAPDVSSYEMETIRDGWPTAHEKLQLPDGSSVHVDRYPDAAYDAKRKAEGYR